MKRKTIAIDAETSILEKYIALNSNVFLLDRSLTESKPLGCKCTNSQNDGMMFEEEKGS